MALPQSFQEALGRAETERQIERDTILQRIGDTVQKGVPLLSGVVAGALSKNPIVGLGATFVADSLQKRFEEKREQRRTRRFEDRQRRQAAKIAVREGLFQNEKEALADIEANRLAEEQENTRKSQQELLQKFGLNREQEEVQDKEKENIEQQEELVREPPQQTGLALESTVSHIDSEISGIADLLLDRFAEEEDRQERAEDRREIEAAQLRETIAEGNRQQTPEGTPVREDREQEEGGGGLLGGVARVFGVLGNIAKIALVGALVGLGVAIGLLIANLDKVLIALGELASEIYIAVLDGIKDGFKGMLDFTGLGAAADEFKQRRQLETEKFILEEEGQKIQARAQDAQQEIVDAEQRQRELNTEIQPIMKKVMSGDLDSLTPQEKSELEQYEKSLRDQQEIIDSNRFILNELQKDRQVLQQKIDDLNQRIDQFLQQYPSLTSQTRSGGVAPPVTAQIGSNMRNVSFDLVAGGKRIIFAPSDQSQVVQNTSVSSKKTIQSIGVSPFNMEMRKKFVV